MFIQKKKDALRCYGTLIHSNTNSNGFNINGISSPSGASQHALITRTYKEAKINPKDVFYIEGHGTGTKAGDPEELNAMASIFLEGRTKDSLPLLVGSVKSNMGHPECASGLCSIAKVLLALENKMIPGNLHYKKPNSNIPALLNGQIKVSLHKMSCMIYFERFMNFIGCESKYANYNSSCSKEKTRVIKFFWLWWFKCSCDS